jgi:hypothetical protein
MAEPGTQSTIGENLSPEDRQAILNGQLTAQQQAALDRIPDFASDQRESISRQLLDRNAQIRTQLLLSESTEKGKITDERRDEVVGELDDDYQGLENAAGLAWEQDQDALGDLLGSLDGYDPLTASDYVGDYESEAAFAEADAGSVEAQRGALAKLKGLTDPTVTAKERFLMESVRMQEEQDRASAMEAALRDLEYRGARSGGAEIAALTGAQQITSQNRLLQDLGTQAGAVDRSMNALDQYGRLASTMRDSSFNEDFSRGSAADAATEFNKGLLSDYNAWYDDFTAGERDKAVERDTLAYDARNNTTNTGYGRQKDLYGAREGAAGLKLGVETEKEDSGNDRLKLLLGNIESDKADRALEEEEEDGFI